MEREKAQVRVVPPRAGAEVAAEMERLEARRLAGRATDADRERLAQLPGELSAAIDAAAVVLVFQVATRRGGFRRGRLLGEARERLEAAGYGQADWQDIPVELRETAIILEQAGSIAGALADGECVNFSAPETADGWLEVPDYVFAPALAAAWTLNPHWAPEVPAVDEKNAGAPGSENS